jgi:hypothetical protein
VARSCERATAVPPDVGCWQKVPTDSHHLCNKKVPIEVGECHADYRFCQLMSFFRWWMSTTGNLRLWRSVAGKPVPNHCNSTRPTPIKACIVASDSGFLVQHFRT